MTNDQLTNPYGVADWLVIADLYQGVVLARCQRPAKTTKAPVPSALVVMVGSQGLGPALKVGVGPLASGVKGSALNVGGRP